MKNPNTIHNLSEFEDLGLIQNANYTYAVR